VANKTIDELDSATLAQFDETTELETQVMDLADPESRKITIPQSRFLHLDLAQLTAELASAVTDPTAAMMLIVDPVLADSANTRNARSMLVSEVQKLMAARSKTMQLQTPAKVGATAGWVVNAANNLGKMATLPASQTGSTLVIPIDGVKQGDIITGFHLTGSIQSAGNTATLTADLRVLTVNAAGAVDSDISAIATPVSVTANTILSATNCGKTGLTHVVADGESYYILVTATTAATTTEEIQAVCLTVTGS
jgi:hypothetical protein